MMIAKTTITTAITKNPATVKRSFIMFITSWKSPVKKHDKAGGHADQYKNGG